MRNALHNELQDVILNWTGGARGRQEGPLFLRGVGAESPYSSEGGYTPPTLNSPKAASMVPRISPASRRAVTTST